jgi:beta-lactamase superfamily II metal-dependent hydrolase
MTDTTLPDRGVVFWPVGTGDSTTVVLDEEHVLQVDLRDLVAADEEDALIAPVVDRLVDHLPTRNGDPYLAVFALTHGDADHCTGFADLLDRVHIGELWATPRLWREYIEDDVELCEDAEAFQAEAERRVAATMKAVRSGREPASGDRVRIIGYDVDRARHPYAELPDLYFTYPGESITTLDGEDVGAVFEAFVHAPFKDDCAAARNDTSLAMQLTLRDADGTAGYLLLFGDLGYDTIRRIFDYSAPRRPERLAWDVLLAAHHCSKKVMYVTTATGEELREDLLDDFEDHARNGARVVASSLPIPLVDLPGANPPHAKARRRYEEVVADPVLCTGEYPSVEDPRPIVFGLVAGEGLALVPVEDLAASEADRAALAGSRSGSELLKALGLTAAVEVREGMVVRAARPSGPDGEEPGSGLDRGRQAVQTARGDTAAPVTPVGFGAP